MVLQNSSISKRRLPINLKDGDLRLFDKEFEKRIPATTLSRLQNVRVNSDSLILKNLNILPQSFVNAAFPASHPSLRMLLSTLIKNYLRREKIPVQEKPCIWFIDNFSRNYFHWLTDALPRLFSVRHLIPTSTILLPYHYERAEFVKSSLRPFGISDLQFIPESQVFLLRDLFLPSPTAVTGNYNDQLIRSMRHFYAPYYSNQRLTIDCGHKIYISRAKASRRKILNEDEVVGLLSRFGFRTVYFEDLSFDEQASIALNAKYLISNHGAGLTNMLFMESGTCVLELRKEDDCNNNCYFSLASALDLEYFYQTCACENNDLDGHMANVASLIVDLQRLRENVVLMLNRKQIETHANVGEGQNPAGFVTGLSKPEL